MIEAAVAAFAGSAPPRLVLDLGTGTGCLLLAALSEFASAFGVGVDRSYPATALAARNGAALGLSDRAAFVCADWAQPLDGEFDLVLCNPPYVRSDDIARLAPEVAQYEPLDALDGGPDGFAAYRHLLPALSRLLGPVGVAVLELGTGQAATVAELARQAGLRAETCPDLHGIPRALILRRAAP